MLSQVLSPKYITLLARILLSIIFIKSGVNKITNFTNTQAYMASKGLPFTEILLVVTIFVLLLGGLSILLGYQAKTGAFLLIGFLIPTTLIFHGSFPEEINAFLKNLGLMGGLLMIVASGSGEISLDKR
ncbi:MAG TPA: DoxX family protein [Cyanothece sp. UBA12306]|nr:DoxX family protein [Cyanothece sp. UBA12306]